MYRYEVLRGDVPLKLFFDVEWPVEGLGDKTESSNKLKLLMQCVQEYGNYHEMFKECIVLDSSRSGKKSYHIIYPNAVFRKIDWDLKHFVLGFVRWLIQDKDLKELTYMKKTKRGEQLRCIVDTAVYTKNRCFRLLGQSKAKDDRPCTKLAPYESDSIVIPEDTLVQSTELLECVHADYIDSLLTSRAPVDGDYKIYPSADKSTVCFRMHKKSGQDKWTSELVVSKKLRRLVVKEDEDILKNLDAEELKQADFTGWFLPVLASLTTAFKDADLIKWMGEEGKVNDKIQSRLSYARQKGSEGNTAVVTCETALAFLKKKHEQVLDMRPDCVLKKPKLQVIEPAESEGWKFVKTGEELKNQLNYRCNADKQSKFERKRTIFISGKMSVGKTKAVLYFAKERLTENAYQHVTYFGPRTALVEQVSKRVEDITLASTVKRRKVVTVRRYYTGMDDDTIEINGLGYREVVYNSNTFHGACINSAAKTPVSPDVVIIDEAVVNVGNMFICSTQSSRRSTKEDAMNEKAIHRDRDIIEAVIERIRNASVVIYIDAAFSQLLMKTLSLIWSTLSPFAIERYSGKERRALQLSLSKAKTKFPHTTFYTDKTCTHNFQVAQDVHLAVYDPGRESGIFTHLHEFTNYQHLKMDIMDSFTSKKPCIIYTSSARTAIELCTMMKSKGLSPAPMMTLVTRESTVRTTGGMDKCLNDMNSSHVVVTSNVMSCGMSFEEQDMFNTAYAVFEFSPYTPPLADMIQLCARVRSISSKTLRYTVISRGSRYYAANDTQNVFDRRREELASSPVCLAFHELNEAEHTDHINMCQQRGYAAACVKKALKAAFTHMKDPTEPPVVPMYTVDPPVNFVSCSSNLPTRGERSRYNNMCRDLPRETTLRLFSRTKRPLTLPRNDLPPEAYHQLQGASYELAQIERKPGSSPSNAVEPVPLKKQKRESLSVSYDPEDSSEAESELETRDEFDCRADI